MNEHDKEIFKEIIVWGGIMTLLYNSQVEDLKDSEVVLKEVLKEAYTKCLTYKGSNTSILKGIKEMVDALNTINSFYPQLIHEIGTSRVPTDVLTPYTA